MRPAATATAILTALATLAAAAQTRREPPGPAGPPARFTLVEGTIPGMRAAMALAAVPAVAVLVLSFFLPSGALVADKEEEPRSA